MGATLLGPDGELHILSHVLDGRGCNNEAEVRALMGALDFLKLQGASVLLVHCDNSIVVEQLTHGGAPPVARLAAWFEAARVALRSFEDARMVWIPRHRNRQADALARAALGLLPKPPAARRKRP